MRTLIAAVIVLVLAMAAMVVVHESNRGAHRVPATGERVATISTGEAVDIDATVPGQGTTIVEFSADF
jgi:hypothetical protein